MADKALRVIAVCYLDREVVSNELNEDLERNLVFVRLNTE